MPSREGATANVNHSVILTDRYKQPKANKTQIMKQRKDPIKTIISVYAAQSRGIQKKVRCYCYYEARQNPLENLSSSSIRPQPAGKPQSLFNRVIRRGQYQPLNSIYDDAWIEKYGDNKEGDGFTCCQEEFLENEAGELTFRIDYVFASGDAFKVKKVEIVGTKGVDQIDSGKWYSDHAGIVTKISFKKQETVP